MKDSEQALIEQIAYPFASIGEKLQALSKLHPDKRTIEYFKSIYNPTMQEIEIGKVYGLEIATAEQAFSTLFG